MKSTRRKKLIMVTGICLATIGLGLLTSDKDWVFKLGAFLLTGSLMFMMIGCTVVE